MNCDCKPMTVTQYIRANKNHDTGLTTLQKWSGCSKCGLPIDVVDTKIIGTSAEELRQRPAPVKKVKSTHCPDFGLRIFTSLVDGVSYKDFNTVAKELRKK